MTTIAFRSGLMASDTQVTGGGVRDCTFVKIARNRLGDLAGAGGDAGYTARFLAWFTGGEKGTAPECRSDNDGADEGMIVRAGGAIEFYDKGGGPFTVSAEYIALGSGRQLALGAMAHGANAEEAVRAAMKHDVYTGGDVTVLRHDNG